MAVKIRLRRMGSNKKPFFRVVVTDMRCPNTGRFLETIGWYDPKRKGANCELRLDRMEYWRTRGAVMSDTVRSLARRQAAAQRRAESATVAPA